MSGGVHQGLQIGTPSGTPSGPYPLAARLRFEEQANHRFGVYRLNPEAASHGDTPIMALSGPPFGPSRQPSRRGWSRGYALRPRSLPVYRRKGTKGWHQWLIAAFMASIPSIWGPHMGCYPLDTTSDPPIRARIRGLLMAPTPSGTLSEPSHPWDSPRDGLLIPVGCIHAV